MPIPKWKWKSIAMDVNVGLPPTFEGFDSIWVVMDHLTKFTHFIWIKEKYVAERLVQLYISKIVRLHRVPVSIVSLKARCLLHTTGWLYIIIWVLIWF